MTGAIHERFSRDEKLVIGSSRSFGMVMAAFFALLAIVSAWLGHDVWHWTGSLSALFLAAALFRPTILNVPNKVWMKFGLLLHTIVNPVIMGFMFYATVLPTGLVMRALGKDLLRLKLQPTADSYWIARKPGPAPETFNDQF